MSVESKVTPPFGGDELLHTGSWDKIESRWMARRQVAEGLPDFRIFYTAGLMLRRGRGLYCLSMSGVAPPTEPRENPLDQSVLWCLPQT